MILPATADVVRRRLAVKYEAALAAARLSLTGAPQ